MTSVSSADIVRPGDGTRLGSGWYPVEHYAGQTFRWAYNDAEITACADANDRTVASLVQLGNAIGASSTKVTIVGNHGDKAGPTTIKAGNPVEMKVNLGPGVSAETFAIHVQSKNLPTHTKDKRTLNFRVLDVALGSSASACANDIVRDGSPLRVGNHWEKYESFAGRSFRWVGNDANVILSAAQNKPFTLEAQVQAGASLGGAPLSIAIRSAGGKTLAVGQPVKLPPFTTPPMYPSEFVQWSLPKLPSGATLILHVNSKNVPVPHDPRKLNFRVFDLKIKP